MERRHRRIKGEDQWKDSTLKKEEENGYLAMIPRIEKENAISAKSNSGKTEAMPRTSPKGFYSFSVE